MRTLPQLTDKDHARFCDLVLRRTGMVFDGKHRTLLARGVLRAAERAGLPRLDAYWSHLQSAATDSGLWADLIQEITVGETYFFRNPRHIAALRKKILPELIARHRGDRRLRIWSAGCASGEEPYSLAILLHQLLPDVDDWNILILATDLSHGALRQARQGRFRAWSFRSTDPAFRQRYFTPVDGAFEIVPQIRDMVSFAYLNLAEDVYPSLTTNTNALDLVLFRNVAIYLPQAVTRRIATQFQRCLVPGGWLIVGASETSQQVFGQYEPHMIEGAALYQWTGSERTRVAPRTKAQDLPAPPRVAPVPSKQPPAAELYKQAREAMAQGQHQAAVQQLLACVRRDPNHQPAHHDLARALANRGQLDEAQVWCQRALDLDPLFTTGHYTLGLIHQEQGQVTEAIACLKRTLYLDPEHILAHHGLAGLYAKAGRDPLAARHLAQAVRLTARLAPDEKVPGADGLTAGRLQAMLRAMEPAEGGLDA